MQYTNTWILPAGNMYSLQYSNQPIFVANGMAGSIVHSKSDGTKLAYNVP